MQLLQSAASLPGGSGQCNYCNALPHCPGARGRAIHVMHCHTPWGQWVVELRRSLPKERYSCNALRHCLG